MFDYLPLVFLGAFLTIGAFFYYFISGVNFYYKKYANLTTGKIIAFKEDTKIRRSSGRVSQSTTIRPVIEYFINGERKIFLGSNQNYINNYIGKEVEIYVVEDKEGYVLQKDNVYKIFSRVCLLFIIIPLLIIFYFKVALIYKVTLPLLGPLILLPIFLRISKIAKKAAQKNGDNRSLIEIIREQLLKNQDIIDIDNYENSTDYIKAPQKFNNKLAQTHLLGLIVTGLFGTGIYYLMAHVYTKKMSTADRDLIQNFLNDLTSYGPLLGEVGKSKDLTGFLVLSCFAFILIIAFIINFNGWIKSR